MKTEGAPDATTKPIEGSAAAEQAQAPAPAVAQGVATEPTGTPDPTATEGEKPPEKKPEEKQEKKRGRPKKEAKAEPVATEAGIPFEDAATGATPNIPPPAPGAGTVSPKAAILFGNPKALARAYVDWLGDFAVLARCHGIPMPEQSIVDEILEEVVLPAAQRSVVGAGKYIATSGVEQGTADAVITLAPAAAAIAFIKFVEPDPAAIKAAHAECEERKARREAERKKK